MDDIMDWLKTAREWLSYSNNEEVSLGRRTAMIRRFAAEKGVDPSSVRRCTTAFHLAEELKSAGAIRSIGDVERLSLEKLTLLNRVARISFEEAIRLFPEIAAGKTVKELRKDEHNIRARLAGHAASQPDANALLNRLNGSLFRKEAVSAYIAAARSKGFQALELTGRGTLVDTSHVLLRVKPGGPFHGARIVSATGLKSYPGRHAEIAGMAGWVARILERVDVIAQSHDDGERVAACLQIAGRCGVGVMTLGEDGKLHEMHQAQRVKRPDLLPKHLASLDSRFPSTGKTVRGRQ